MMDTFFQCNYWQYFSGKFSLFKNYQYLPGVVYSYYVTFVDTFGHENKAAILVVIQ